MLSHSAAAFLALAMTGLATTPADEAASQRVDEFFSSGPTTFEESGAGVQPSPLAFRGRAIRTGDKLELLLTSGTDSTTVVIPKDQVVDVLKTDDRVTPHEVLIQPNATLEIRRNVSARAFYDARTIPTEGFGIGGIRIRNPLESIINEVTKAEIRFRNETDQPITVVMDSNRERRDIAPHAQALFGEANIGDAPTFRVLNAQGQEVFGRQVGPVGRRSSFGWNGTGF